MGTVKASILVFVLLALEGCGFHLRGAVDLPIQRRVVALRGIDLNHPFARELAQLLALSGGGLTGNPATAGSLLVIRDIREERRVVSLDEHGKAVEFELVYRLHFDATTSDGKVLLAPQAIAIHRIYLNTQLQVIGKAEEEGVIRREMVREAARTLLRRLQQALQNHED